tara:strand:+ start:297 stop:1097 length:801 start_codon:yes stop_codon:yes gene_type:complete
MALSTIGTNSVADSAVTSAKISDGTIATGDIANDAITGAKVADLDALTVSGDLTVQGTTTAQGTTVGFVTFDKLLLNATDGSATDAGDNLVLNGTDATSANADSSVLFEDGTGDPNFASKGKVLKAQVNEISTISTRSGANSYADDLDFGSFTPSSTNSTVMISGVAYMDGHHNHYLYYRWVIDGVNYVSEGNGEATMTIYNGTTNNAPSLIPCPIVTSVANTDGSNITVVCQGRLHSSNNLYINRTQTDTYTGAKSSVMFVEVEN